MDYRSQLRRLRHETAQTASGVANECEAGRAETPFGEQLKALSGDPLPALRVAVFATRPEALQALLSEIIGLEYKVCKVVVPSRLGFTEVILQERGYQLDSGAGSREFGDAESFLEALEKSGALNRRNGEAENYRLKLKAPQHLDGLCLLVPHTLDALHHKPALISSLADQADWVFLAGCTDDAVTPEQRQSIQLVLDHVTGLQLVQVPPAPDATTDVASPKTTPTEPWHKGWRVTLSLGLVKLGSELLRQRLALLTATQSELRHYLTEVRLGRQLDSTLQLMDEELAQAQRSLTHRLQLSREGLLTDSATSDLRKTSETIRTRLTEECESLLKAAEREAKQALSSDGESTRRLREAAQALTVDDIAQTPGEVTVKLSLDDDAARRLGDLVSALSQTRLSTEARQIREGFECSVRDAEAALEKATGLRHRLTWELPDETALSATLITSRPELRYRGEMPRATLMARLGSARQMVMGLMIVGTLVGGAAALTGDSSPGSGGGARTLIASIMLPMMIVGFLWTYVSFRKQERLTLTKEVDKLHDGVATELRRVLQDVFRDQQAALSSALQKAQKAVQTQVENALEKTQQLRQRETEDLRKRAAEQQRSAEQRLARLRQMAQQITNLRPRVAEAQKMQQPWLAAWIERFNQGKS